MNSFILILPLIVIRFFLLGRLNKEALIKAQHFAPLQENEKLAYYLYQIASLMLIIFPLFQTLKLTSAMGQIGFLIYLGGLLILLVATVNFANAKDGALKTQGIYRFSRNPMYLGYFFTFLGCVMLSQSWVLLVSLIVFQVTSHWIILSEERWCQTRFGAEYSTYQNKVRRYI